VVNKDFHMFYLRESPSVNRLVHFYAGVSQSGVRTAKLFFSISCPVFKMINVDKAAEAFIRIVVFVNVISMYCIFGVVFFRCS